MDNRSTKNTILLVDDERAVLDVATLQIKKLGYKALQATNGMEAIQIFQDNVNDICLVILDEKLPDKLGTDICKRLKEFEPDVKVLHTSGLGIIQGHDSLECGCEAFLLKPFRIEQLSNEIKDLLENTSDSQSGELNVAV
jgi:two-component system cell cycle sensor histidine kinase/response regulator CckA